ncbi:MAG: hypothetical protein FJ245_13445 [Nitrospira sp.]|nr:hypothetical protein [Nitrospira sp.]
MKVLVTIGSAIALSALAATLLFVPAAAASEQPAGMSESSRIDAQAINIETQAASTHAVRSDGKPTMGQAEEMPLRMLEIEEGTHLLAAEQGHFLSLGQASLDWELLEQLGMQDEASSTSF